MIAALAIASFSSARNWDPSYSLLPPHRFTELSEIGNWTLRGSALNLKKFIRLTTNVADQSGGVCLRIPTRFRDWRLQIEIAIHDGGESGGGLTLYFTEQVCPDVTAWSTGFGIWFDMRSTEPDGGFPVYFFSGTGPKDERRKIGSAKLQSNSTHPVTLEIFRSEDKLTIDAVWEYEYRRIGVVEEPNLLKFGYFTLIATSTKGGDVQDLTSLRVFILEDLISAKHAPKGDVDYSSVNRKAIAQAKQKRKESKKRRRKDMPTVFELVEDAKDGQLTGGPVDIRNALKVLAEAGARARQDVTLKQLSELINGPISRTVEAADRRLRHASERFSETQEEIIELWSSLKTSLVDLELEAVTEMAAIEATFITVLETLNLTAEDIDDALKMLKRKARGTGDTSVTMLLMSLSIIEVVCYVAFFCIKRQTTRGFKKAD
jgi:hypothetical protein